MNIPKCNEYLYINFLLAAQKNYTCDFLSKVAPQKMSHDCPTRLLTKKRLTPKILWKNIKSLISDGGFLIVDDVVLDKPYSQKNDLVRLLYSSTHHRIVKGSV